MGEPASRGTAAAPGAWHLPSPDWLVVLVVAVVAFLTRSWEGDLHGDPVRYAAVAKTMVATGDWLNLQDCPGIPYANKPPLMFWLVALNFRLFGISTYTAKLWSCLFGIGTCMLTWLTGRRLFGRPAGLLAGCVLALSGGFAINVMDLRLDSAVAFFVVLAVYAALRAASDGQPRWLLLAGLALGLGAMEKPSAALHVAVLVPLVLALRRPRMLLTPSILGALFVAGLIAAPWHIGQYVRHADDFTAVYLREQMGSRMVPGVHVFRNLLANIGILAFRALPWWLFGAYALLQRSRAGQRERAAMLLCVLWIAEVVVLMAVPANRFDRYVIPAYPAIALLAGYGLYRALPARLHEAVPRAVLCLAAGWALLLAVTPVPLHTYTCRGFVTAGQVLDRLAPGEEVVVFDQRFPSGPAGDPEQWNVRSKTYYYMGRRLRNCASLAELLAGSEEFVIASSYTQDMLTDSGFRAFLQLDGSYSLLQREPPSGGDPANRRGGGP